MQWHQVTQMRPKQFLCGYCGFSVASDLGYYSNSSSDQILICPNCQKPTYFDAWDRQIPGAAFGSEVKHLPNSVQQLYREARDCCTTSAYTAAVLSCRKILMNIAVDQGADAGKSFASYVDHLADGGFIPPNGRAWVDHIRKRGNEATHEIALMSKSDAEDLVAFVEMLLKFIYEFPARVPNS